MENWLGQAMGNASAVASSYPNTGTTDDRGYETRHMDPSQGPKPVPQIVPRGTWQGVENARQSWLDCDC